MTYNLQDFKNTIDKIDNGIDSLELSELIEIKNRLEGYSNGDFAHEALANTAVGAQPARLANNRQANDYLRQCNDFPALNNAALGIANNLTLATNRLVAVNAKLVVKKAEAKKLAISEIISEIETKLSVNELTDKAEELLGKDWKTVKFANKNESELRQVRLDLLAIVEKKIKSGGSPSTPTDVKKVVEEYLKTDEGKKLLNSSDIDLDKELKDDGVIGKKIKELVAETKGLKKEDLKEEFKKLLADEEVKKSLSETNGSIGSSWKSWLGIGLGAVALVFAIAVFFMLPKSKEEGEGRLEA